MRRRFIINPRAGGCSSRTIARLEAYFRRHIGRLDCVLARTREQAIYQTRRALQESVDQLVAVGGDGTLNAVLNGMFSRGRLLRPECVLAVADLGTGSDYFRTISQGRRCDWRRVVLEHRVRQVDVGCVRFGAGDERTQCFLNMASAGLIAEVVRRKNHGPRHLPGPLQYALPMLQAFCAARPVRMWLSADGESIDAELLAVAVSKGVWAGRGIRFGGAVGLDDGRFDVTLFGPLPRSQMFLKIPWLYAGRFDREESVRKLVSSRVTIRSSRPQPVEFDGEICGCTDVEIEVWPRAVRVCFPVE